MTFLAPWAAWFLAGMPVIVLLYLLKLKRRPVTVSTLIFWNRVMRESRRRALFHKLRNPLSLLLHLLIFLLIVGALAKPVFDRFVRAGSSTVLIVDGRARMQAIEPGGESRFEKARRSVAGYIRQASAARQIALLSVHASSQVMVPFTGDEKPLREALDTLEVSDAAGNLEDAIRLGEELLAARKGERRIVVFTDNATLQPTGAARNAAIDFVAVGTPRENIAITRLAARPLMTSPDTSELLIELRNFSRTPARGNIELALDGKLLDVRPFEMEAGGRKLDVFPWVPRPGAARGWLTARLDGTDALAADNVAYASLPPPRPSRVLLVTRGNWFLEKLLAADQQVKFELLEPEAFQLAMAAQFDVVILDKFLPAGFELGRSPGNVLFIKESPFAESAVPLEQPVITDIDTAHPVMRLVDWQNVTILRATALRLPPSADGWAFHSPLRAFEHPLLLVGARQTSGAAQRVAALAFDVADSDLPLRVAFPLLMANTVHWLAARQSAPVLAVRAGESLTLEPDQAISTRPQTKMDASPAKPAAMARDLFVPLENGFYLMEQSAGRQWVAVNTFSEGESDLRGAGTGSVVAPPGMPRVSLVNAASWPFWQYLALTALLLSTIEWWLFHRRRTE